MRVMPGILSQSDVRHLPIIAAFVKKIGVSEEVNRLCAARRQLLLCTGDNYTCAC